MITDPIIELSRTAGRMAAGDLSQEIVIEGKTEIAALGAAINTMSSNLREMLGKIKQTGASLGDAHEDDDRRRPENEPGGAGASRRRRSRRP